MGEDGTELKSKFLRGEYYLKPLACSAVGNNIYSTNPAGLDDQQPKFMILLLLVQLLKHSTMLNDGNPCVDHGEIVLYH